jgi:hypothetical protein
VAGAITNDTKVTTSAAGGALAVVAVFVENKLGAGVTAEVAAAQVVLFSALLGLVLPSR